MKFSRFHPIRFAMHSGLLASILSATTQTLVVISSIVVGPCANAASFTADTWAYGSGWHYGGGSLAYADGVATLNAQAVASYGQLGTAVRAMVNTGTSNYQAEIGASARFADRLIIDGGDSLNGTNGFIAYAFDVQGGGTLNVTGNGGMLHGIYGSLVRINQEGTSQNILAVGASNIHPLNASPFGPGTSSYEGQAVTSRLLQFTFGIPFELSVSFETRFASMVGAGTSLDANFDFLHTATLQNISIFDASRTAVSNANFTLAADSGFDYGHPPASVSEDGSTLVFLVGLPGLLLGMGYRRKRSQEADRLEK